MNKYVKLLVESIFDDEMFNDDNDDGGIGDMLEQEFQNLCKNTLCVSEQYHNIMPEDKEDGLTTLLYDPNDPSKLYVGLTATYKSLNLGPRKRKKYDVSYFYRYTITFNDDGTISLYIKYYNPSHKCIISSQVCKFIEQCSYKIDTIYFVFNSSESTTTLREKFNTMLIIGDNFKISDKLVQNFPDDIQPHANEEEQESLPKKTMFYKQNFSSDKSFFELLNKVVNLGYIVVDNEGNRYDKTNVSIKTEDVLSGEKDKRLALEDQKRLQFIENKLGQDKKGVSYVTKLEKIIDYYLNTKKSNNFYLKTINTLRNENRINLANTVYNLKKDNNLINVVDKNDENYDSTYGYLDDDKIDFNLLRIILYKMYYILDTEELKSYRDDTTLSDCIHGYDVEVYYVGTVTKNLDINDLPIKINSPADLWKYYYVIAKALIQCKDLKERDKHNTYNVYISERDIQKLNANVNVNLNTFNFDYLTEQLKFIIDKTFKKLKLK